MTTLEKTRPSLTAAEMEARIVRYGELRPGKTAFIDAHAPRSKQATLREVAPQLDTLATAESDGEEASELRIVVHRRARERRLFGRMLRPGP